MSKRPRRRFSDVQKTKAVLSHVQDGVPVSQVCEDLGIHPNQYYEWQKQSFSSLPHVFSRDAVRQKRSHQREVDNLKAKLSHKDKVIAELLTEHIERVDDETKWAALELMLGTSSSIVALAKKMAKPETKTVTRTIAIPQTKVVKQQ